MRNQMQRIRNEQKLKERKKTGVFTVYGFFFVLFFEFVLLCMSNIRFDFSRTTDLLDDLRVL